MGVDYHGVVLLDVYETRGSDELHVCDRVVISLKKSYYLIQSSISVFVKSSAIRIIVMG